MEKATRCILQIHGHADHVRPRPNAAVIGLTNIIKDSDRALLSFAVVATGDLNHMLITYLSLAYAKNIFKKIGSQSIDAPIRIVGLFISAKGVGLIFHGMVKFPQSYGVLLNGVTK